MSNKVGGTEFDCRYEFREGEVKVFLEGLEVLHVLLNPENFAEGLFKRLEQGGSFTTTPDGDRQRIHQRVRERLSKEISDEELSKLEAQARRGLELRLLKESVDAAAKATADTFLESVTAFWEKVLNLAAFTGANSLRDLLNAPETKYSTRVIEESLIRIDRERLRALIGEPARGGARNVKHTWTDEERDCLVAKYKELQPIWIEAKRIAKGAQKSRERTRKKEWRAEVLRAYPHLPADLLERYANPRADDAKPSDIAVIHAKRECGITEEYSPKHLREQIRAWKLKTSS
jgi:hypothetical protein